MYDLEAVARVLETEHARQVAQESSQGGRDNQYWASGYTWENALDPEDGGTTSVFDVRWVPHPEKLPGGYRLNSVHTLRNGPNDRDPLKVYCKECFYPRDESGALPEEHGCFFCDALSAFDTESLQMLQTIPPLRSGFSGKEIYELLFSTDWKSQGLAARRKVLVPFLVQATAHSIVVNGRNKDVLVPSNNPEEVLGIVVDTFYNGALWKDLLNCYREDKNLGDFKSGRWMRLTRTKSGRGYKTSLANSITSSPLDGTALKVIANYPKIAEWGKNAPGDNSTRKTLNLKYAEAEHAFMRTSWFRDLQTMTSPEFLGDDAIDWG